MTLLGPWMFFLLVTLSIIPRPDFGIGRRGNLRQSDLAASGWDFSFADYWARRLSFGENTFRLQFVNEKLLKMNSIAPWKRLCSYRSKTT